MKLFFAVVFSFLLLPQSSKEKILWKENQKLTWEDFRGKPIRSANFVASTHTGISFTYSYTLKNGKMDLKYSVESFFYPEESWFRPDKVSPYILKHEQTHFDISELYARILRKRLGEKSFSKNIKPEIEAVYRQVEQKKTRHAKQVRHRDRPLPKREKRSPMGKPHRQTISKI
jgi:hypothetical protein